MGGRYVWPGDGQAAVWVEDTDLVPAPGVYSPAQPVAPPGTSGGLITRDLLRKLGWVQPDFYATAMAAILPEFGIVGWKRVAHWLAQTGHESGKGKWRREIWGPTEAQRRYEGREDLGNTQPGDGSRFRGRGILQVTGRHNYEALAKALGITVEETIAWLETLEGAVTGSAWWWKANGCNELADAGDVKKVTRKVNGGYNGLKERTRLYIEALEALKSHV